MANVETMDAETGSGGDANSAEDEDEEMLHSSKLLRIRRETQATIPLTGVSCGKPANRVSP